MIFFILKSTIAPQKLMLNLNSEYHLSKYKYVYLCELEPKVLHFFYSWKRLLSCHFRSKSSEWVKMVYFFFLGCILFSVSIFIFFLEKCLSWSKSHHPHKILEPEKKIQVRKKKYTIFTHLFNFERKWHESNLFQE